MSSQAIIESSLKELVHEQSIASQEPTSQSNLQLPDIFDETLMDGVLPDASPIEAATSTIYSKECVPLNVELVVKNIKNCKLQTFETMKLLMNSRSKTKDHRAKESVNHAKSYSASCSIDAEDERCSMADMDAEEYKEIDNVDQEVILSASVFLADKPTKKLVEMKLLGSCLLTELRDRIYCSSDTIYHMSGGPGSSSHSFRSSFLFIEDTFYNDFRDENCADYSSFFLDWMESRQTIPDSRFSSVKRTTALNQDRSLAPFIQYEVPDFSGRHFKATSMDGIRLDQIGLHLNKPYLFFHYGDCEHILVFTELRTFHAELDSRNRLAYPHILFQVKNKRRKCRICDTYSAAWVTFDDRLAPENPCFFCKDCYRMLHLDYTGKVQYSEHLLYPYINE